MNYVQIGQTYDTLHVDIFIIAVKSQITKTLTSPNHTDFIIYFDDFTKTTKGKTHSSP